jgi:hypothetical protein
MLLRQSKNEIFFIILSKIFQKVQHYFKEDTNPYRKKGNSYCQSKASRIPVFDPICVSAE